MVEFHQIDKIMFGIERQAGLQLDQAQGKQGYAVMPNKKKQSHFGLYQTKPNSTANQTKPN